MLFDIDVAKQRGALTVGVSVRSDARITALFGPSGSGKTSVLNMIAGLLRPDRGHIRIDGLPLFDTVAGIDVAPEQRRIGYIFQDGRLFPHRSVRDNLLYGWRRTDPAARWMSMSDVVDFLGIGQLLSRNPRTLSGGEAQRVAIGRALLGGARVLLMDEPLASLDRARREEVMRVIEGIRDELAIPILYVSHDHSEIERLAGSIVELGGPS